jgi:ureidoacrylate peracid hydrolase
MANGKKMLQADYHPVEIDLARTAVLIIDMQNAFCTKGAMFDLWGFDIKDIPAIIPNIKEIANTARANKIKVISLAHVLYPDVREVGPMTSFWYNKVLTSYREKPEWRDKLLMRGTWGAAIIDELKPQPDEIYIEKQRFSAFAGTYLDITLRTFDIRYLIVTGTATNICVESSIRDACHLQYLPILVSDGASASPSNRQHDSIENIKQCFGWVTTTKDVLKIMK